MRTAAGGQGGCEQAALFNDPDSGFDVLVASDAVGMGLNLNIRRVLFHRLEKWEGQGVVPLSASAAKQIAGRARGGAWCVCSDLTVNRSIGKETG